MAGTRVPREELQELADLLAEHEGNQAAVHRVSGIPRSTIYGRLKLINQLGIKANARKEDIEYPDIPADDISTPEIIDQMVRRYEKRKEHYDAKQWMEIKINVPGPIGISFLGDPHVDDNGCQWPLLRRHAAVLALTEAMYAVNIGDSHNNWVGRLQRLYADQDTSRETAIKLVEWLFRDSGINWLAIILGNHDMWNFGGDILKWFGRGVAPVEDWQVRLNLTFPAGRDCRIWAAHDFKGHSQWNPLHGLMKRAAFGGSAHVYVAGHKHNWAAFHTEDDQTGQIYWTLRARGYKTLDDHAEHLGFGIQEEGAAMTIIVDPEPKTETGFVTAFADLEEAAEYLTWKRERWSRTQ